MLRELLIPCWILIGLFSIHYFPGRHMLVFAVMFALGCAALAYMGWIEYAPFLQYPAIYFSVMMLMAVTFAHRARAAGQKLAS